MFSLPIILSLLPHSLAAPVNTPRAVNALALDAQGVEFIAGFEGFRPDFYIDAAGVRTIGYGHACQTTSDCSDIVAPITKTQGQSLLNSDANTFEACVNADVKVPITQNEFNALVSFAFNLGCGNLADIAQLLNTDSAAAATASMKNYVNAGGQELPGLVTRRQKEVELFNS